MVMKEFNTDALEGLRTHEQLDLLNSIDSLRSQGISHYISLPQLIVCGDQSSGKSSVLEVISGVSFPVKSSLCTWFPTELILCKNHQEGVKVSVVPHQSCSKPEQRSLVLWVRTRTLRWILGRKPRASKAVKPKQKLFVQTSVLRISFSSPA